MAITIYLCHSKNCFLFIYNYTNMEAFIENEIFFSGLFKETMYIKHQYIATCKLMFFIAVIYVIRMQLTGIIHVCGKYY